MGIFCEVPVREGDSFLLFSVFFLLPCGVPKTLWGWSETGWALGLFHLLAASWVTLSAVHLSRWTPPWATSCSSPSFLACSLGPCPVPPRAAGSRPACISSGEAGVLNHIYGFSHMQFSSTSWTQPPSELQRCRPPHPRAPCRAPAGCIQGPSVPSILKTLLAKQARTE